MIFRNQWWHPTKFDHYYMDVAKRCAQLSHAERLKVGAVAVIDNRIVSDGYNGTAPGENNCCEDENGNTKPEVIHSEMNLIFKAAKHGQSLNGATVYLTYSPCVPCSRALKSVGIAKLIYDDEYRDISGIEYLKSRGIEVHKFESE